MPEPKQPEPEVNVPLPKLVNRESQQLLPPSPVARKKFIMKWINTIRISKKAFSCSRQITKTYNPTR